MHLFQFHVFGHQRVIFKAKQLLQLQYASEELETLYAPASRCNLGVQKFLRGLDKISVDGSSCTIWTLALWFSLSIPVQQLPFTEISCKTLQKFWAPKLHLEVGACKVSSSSEAYCSCKSCLARKITLWWPKTWNWNRCMFDNFMLQAPRVHM